MLDAQGQAVCLYQSFSSQESLTKLSIKVFIAGTSDESPLPIFCLYRSSLLKYRHAVKSTILINNVKKASLSFVF